jgi:superfamily II DNA/RNA helicase
MDTKWSSLRNKVSQSLLDAIEEFGFKEMTPVQVIKRKINKKLRFLLQLLIVY